jgi:hypothetical protein
MQAKHKRKPTQSKSVVIPDHILLDPRQLQCWNLYVDPKSETFGNANQSALAAGYSAGHSNLITTEGWFKERVRRLNMLSKAERNLEDALDLPMKTQAMGAFGPLYKMRQEKRKMKDGKTKTVSIPMLNKPIMVHNIGLLTLRTNTAEFIAERVGRSRYGKKDDGGGNTYNIIVFQDAQRKRIAQRVIGGGSAGSSAS